MDLQAYLDHMGVSYRTLRHDAAFTAAQLAETEHIPGRRVIKPVIVNADGQYVMCALPATHRIDMDTLKGQLDATQVLLVDEQAMRELFPDCELGAEPPIGRLFGLPMLLDESALADDRVTFQAGTHCEAVTMTLAEYRRIAQPEVAYFGRHI